MDLVEAAQHASDDGSFELGGERFAVTDLFPGGRDGAFSLIKPRAAIDAYRLLLGGFDRPRMIELGIAYGGSVGFLALAADPTKFVAIEVNETRVEIVDDFIERRGLADIVVPVYGVDQSDRSVLHEIVQREFGGEPLDLVIDDASHQYEPTVASFEALFPYLREGGAYVIEDWNSDHGAARLIEEGLGDESSQYHDWATKLMTGDGAPSRSGRRPLATVAAERLGAPRLRPDELPLPQSRVALQLTLAAAESSAVVASVEVSHEWIVVRRGDGALQPGSFRLQHIAVDRFSALGPEVADTFSPPGPNRATQA